MKLLISVLFAFAALAGCAHASSRAGRNSGCEVTSLADVFREPLRYVGKRFCGEALAVPEGRVLKIFPPSQEIPAERNDTVMFLDGATADALDPPDRQPFGLYIEGVIEVMEECFQPPSSEMETACTPFRHPINITASAYRRLSSQ